MKCETCKNNALIDTGMFFNAREWHSALEFCQEQDCKEPDSLSETVALLERMAVIGMADKMEAYCSHGAGIFAVNLYKLK